jgi:hypothetical protein
MLEQFQTQLKEAEVATVGSMDDLDSAISFGDHTQVDNPDVGQARGDHQAR